MPDASDVQGNETEAPQPIRPRTRGERRAFIAGFTDCLLKVHDDGFEEAQKWLKFLTEAEDIFR